jgi:hypothetical protein
MTAAIRVIRASDIQPRPAPPPLEDARVSSAVSRQRSASARLQQAQAELDKLRKTLADAHAERREALASGRRFAVDLDALSRDMGEQESLVADIAAMLEAADIRLAAARTAAPSDEEVRAIESDLSEAVEGYAAWILDGAERLRALETLRVRASARLGHPSGLEVDLKMALGHSAKAHEILKQTGASSAFTRAAWRTHVG